jgi:PST family polysaccharide transporter
LVEAVLSYNLSNFVARNLDNILIGWRAGPLQLGLYDRAYKLLQLPLQHLNNPAARVMVPVLSRLAADPTRYRSAYIRVTQQILLAALPGMVFMIATAETLVPTLLGAKWAGAAPIFVWLGIAGLHQPMSGTIPWLFVSQSRTSEYARWGLFNAVTCAAAFFSGLPWGALGVAIAYALSDVLIRLPALWWYVGRKGPVTTLDLCKLAIPFAIAAAAAALVLRNIDRTIVQNVVAYLAIACIASYATCGVVLLAFPDGRAVLRESFGILTAFFAATRRSANVGSLRSVD